MWTPWVEAHRPPASPPSPTECSRESAGSEKKEGNLRDADPISDRRHQDEEEEVREQQRGVGGGPPNSEHERWLADEVFKGPVIVYNYPKDIKAFYVKLCDRLSLRVTAEADEAGGAAHLKKR